MILYNEAGQILVVRRSITAPRRPLQWDFPGGIVDPGEHPEATAVRETIEEVSLNPGEVKLIDVITIDSPEHVVLVFYRGTTKSDVVKLSFEHDQYKWIDPIHASNLHMHPEFKRAVKVPDQELELPHG